MKIKWIGSFDKLDLPKIDLPQNAVCISSEKETEEKMLIDSLPFVFIAIINACFFYFLKYITKGKAEVDVNSIWALLLSALLLVIFLPVHEYLHAIMYPADSVVYMGVLQETGGMFISSQSPITKGRYIVMTIFPFCILSLIPFIAYYFVPIDKTFLNFLLFCFASMSNLSVIGDFYNIYETMKKVPENAIMQVSDNKMYYYV